MKTIKFNNLKLIEGDCILKLKELSSNSIDACVTDPPAGISFMNKEWDKDKGGRNEWMSWMIEVFQEVLRVLKPGGHCLVWSIPRTSHWTAMSLENAGFEIRDCVYHIQGQGFPKSHNVGMGIDKKMKLIDHQAWAFNHAGKEGSQVFDKKHNYELSSSNGYKYEGKSEEAKKYDGYGSQLKPAVECWWLIRKPFKGSIVDNVLKYGTGGLNIDKSRIGTEQRNNPVYDNSGNYFNGDTKWNGTTTTTTGRFPSNLTHDGSDEVMQEFEKYGDEGSVARFFYCSKTSTAERNTGIEDKNVHPTIKPVKLMSYLINLIMPPTGIVLDPFMGSGSTGIAALLNGYDFIGIEMDKCYIDIAQMRINEYEKYRKFLK
jgi:site-specific DNA-methyltransferase (adenine-specific)